MNIKELLDMGVHSTYIWTAYFITLFVFGINLVTTLIEKRRVKKIIKQHYES